jgi:ABC-type nitrate/sulfonate/bicarbonate transport system ATPase subunit
MIALDRVSRVFTTPGGGSYCALDQISLSIPSGAFCAIVGPSGCGKSTLLNIVAGLLEPSSGTVRVADAPLVGLNRRATYMFQQDALLPWKDVRENVALGLTLAGVPRGEARARADDWLGRVGLAAFADHFPSQLSGGMRKRVTLAQNLIIDRDILLMDEPFSALDIHTRQRMETELLALWEGSGSSRTLPNSESGSSRTPDAGSGSSRTLPNSESGSSRTPDAASGSSRARPDGGSGSSRTPDAASGSSRTLRDAGSGSSRTPPDAGSGSSPTLPDAGSGSSRTLRDAGSGSSPTLRDAGTDSSRTRPDAGAGPASVVSGFSRTRKTILFVTHDLEEALVLADLVVVLSAAPSSRVVSQHSVTLGRPRDLLELRTQPAFVDLYRAVWADLRDEVIKSQRETRA